MGAGPGELGMQPGVGVAVGVRAASAPLAASPSSSSPGSSGETWNRCWW
ncbi:MAG TPA: hypothetical protein VGP05_12965 [Pseudonocardia sp.]|nr:hypothetical protein [Pseudonocardia sp.]